MIYRTKYILPIAGDVIENGEVLVRDGEIIAVGTGLSCMNPDEQVCDLGDAALLPGFVNAHSHIDYTLNRNLWDALNLWDWIDKVGFRKDCKPDYDVILKSAMLGAAQCVASGMTCLGDSSFSGAAAQAMERIGLRGIVYKEVFGQSMGDNYVQLFAENLNNIRDMQSQVSPLLTIGVSPHSIYTSSREVLALCAELDIPVSIHLAETIDEAEYTLYGVGHIAGWRRKLGYEPMISGLSPAYHLNEVGLLKKGVCLAHCVHVSEEEVDLIAASGASVVHCPRSNAYLGAGVAPLAQFIADGAVVGIGTDSASSCMRLDLFEEMRFAMGFARACAKDAGVVTAKDVLKLATIGGAKALGLDAKIGTIEPGKRADMVAVDVSEMLLGEDIYLSVMSRSPADVKVVMVDGVEVAKDGCPVNVDINECGAKLSECLEDRGIG